MDPRIFSTSVQTRLTRPGNTRNSAARRPHRMLTDSTGAPTRRFTKRRWEAIKASTCGPRMSSRQRKTSRSYRSSGVAASSTKARFADAGNGCLGSLRCESAGEPVAAWIRALGEQDRVGWVVTRCAQAAGAGVLGFGRGRGSCRSGLDR